MNQISLARSRRFQKISKFVPVLFLAPCFSHCAPKQRELSPASEIRSDEVANWGERAAAKGFTFNVMAPLNLPTNESEWSFLRARLMRMQQLGAYAVSTDVWWGLVEPGDHQFAWGDYEKLATIIGEAGLKWVPILSFHQCGGNVGDDCNIPLPAWLWKKYPEAVTKSEWGNISRESLSVWETPQAIGEYRAVMEDFRRVFARFAPQIAEINISMGPAGELRFPSYNSHDGGRSGYPTRGALQGYSGDAATSFRKFSLRKWHDLQGLAQAWQTPLSSEEQIRLPDNMDLFYGTSAWKSAYGRDVYEWYHGSLLAHGKLLGETALQVFGDAQSPMRGIAIGAKVPGVHWRMASDRLAEMNAGLIPAQDGQQGPRAADYADIVGVFAALDAKAKQLSSRFVLHFTCLEMGDHENDGQGANSLAQTLVRIVGEEAARQGVSIKGENALSGTLANDGAWNNMREAIVHGPYHGLTILRFDDILQSDTASRRFSALVQEMAQPSSTHQ